jgi:glycosyltransferase involved in cell wall biosynthesis
MAAGATVSAVIPVHNGEAYVAEAISSTLSQTRPPVECLVIDDGSSDGTPDAVRRLGTEVTYIRQERSGVSVARNRGAELARGDLVAFLDHDDVWLPRKLECQAELLREHRGTFALCAMEVVDPRGNVLATKRLRPRRDLLTGMLMFDGTETVSCSSTGLIDRSTLIGMGGFDPALSMSADWDLLVRVLLGGEVAYIDEPLVRYRLHETNMSRDVSAMERDMTHTFGKTFADRRLPEAIRARKRRAYGRLYRMLAGSYRDSGDRRDALRTFAMAVRHDPAIMLDLAHGLRPAHRAPHSA